MLLLWAQWGDKIGGVKDVSSTSMWRNVDRKAQISHDKLDGASKILKKQTLVFRIHSQLFLSALKNIYAGLDIAVHRDIGSGRDQNCHPVGLDVAVGCSNPCVIL